MILKGRVQVGLGGVTGIASLGEQGQVGKAKPGGERPRLRQIVRRSPDDDLGVDETSDEGNSERADDGDGDGGRPRGHGSNLRMAAATSAVGVPSEIVAASLPSGPTR